MPPIAAYQRIGVNLRPFVEHYDPEPDVAVVEVAAGADPRYAERFFLAAEVVSASDLRTVEGKCEVYQRHPFCECVLVIRQDRFETQADVRAPGGWTRARLHSRTDELSIPAFGLRCPLSKIYRGTMVDQGAGTPKT